jgi:hypothetical protein
VTLSPERLQEIRDQLAFVKRLTAADMDGASATNIAHIATDLLAALDAEHARAGRFARINAEMLDKIETSDPALHLRLILEGAQKILAEEKAESHRILSSFGIRRTDDDGELTVAERLVLLEQAVEWTAEDTNGKPGPPQPPSSARQERLIRRTVEKRADSWERIARKLAEALEPWGCEMTGGCEVAKTGNKRCRSCEALAEFRALTEQGPR